MKYKVTLQGRTYEIEVQGGKASLLAEYDAAAAPVAAAPTAAPAPAASAAAAPVAAGDGEAITAPMPGTILRVNAAQGDSVKAGQVLIVLEAMKMENEILAPRDGVVKQVITTKGSSVDTGAALMVLG